MNSMLREMLTGQLSRSIGLTLPDTADTLFLLVNHAVQNSASKWLPPLVKRPPPMKILRSNCAG
jgi:hypothetical protein